MLLIYFFGLFILLPFTGIMLLIWLLTRKKIFGIILGVIWLSIFALIFLIGFLNWISAKTILEKDDYYGEYTVNRDYFPGPQADWQYNNFRFEIKPNDSIFFYVTNKEKIVKTYKGKIKTTTAYNSDRLILSMQDSSHHIVSSNPTTYRSAWSFYLVFYSPKFKNVFFKKGKWKPID